MPPRFAYWTIILDGAPTSFRTKERDEILPLFNQLKAKNPAALLKWFSGGRLWDSPEQAKELRSVEKVRRFRDDRSKQMKAERESGEDPLAEFRRKHGGQPTAATTLRLAMPATARSGQVSHRLLPGRRPTRIVFVAARIGPARGVPAAARQASRWQRSAPASASGVEPGLRRPQAAKGAETGRARPRRARSPRQGLATRRRAQRPARHVQAAARRSSEAVEGPEPRRRGAEALRVEARRGPPVRDRPHGRPRQRARRRAGRPARRGNHVAASGRPEHAAIGPRGLEASWSAALVGRRAAVRQSSPAGDRPFECEAPRARRRSPVRRTGEGVAGPLRPKAGARSTTW